MNFTLVSTAEASILHTGRWRIPAAEVVSLRDTVMLVEAVSARAATIEAEAESARRVGHAEGRAAGLAEGLAEGRFQAAVALMELAANAREELDELRERVGALALQIVRRIAFDLGPQTIVAALADRAIRELLPDQPVVLRVAPEVAVVLEQREWPLKAMIEVVADDRLKAMDCVLQTQHGQIDAGLEAQLKALATAFAEARRNEGQP